MFDSSKYHADQINGFSEYELRKLMRPDEWDEFALWIRGQGTGVGLFGQTVYFTSDVDRFSRGLKRRVE